MENLSIFVKFNLLKYFETTGTIDGIIKKALNFENTIMDNNLIINSAFYFPLEINLISLCEEAGILLYLLMTYPKSIQRICLELVLQTVNDSLQPKYEIFLEQIIAPLVIINPPIILERFSFGHLYCIRGVVIELTLPQKFIRCSNWKCTEACPHSNRCLIVHKYPKTTPLCPSCAATLKEVTSGRDLGSYVQGKIISSEVFSAPQHLNNMRSIEFHIEDHRIPNTPLELGREYIMYGVQTTGAFKVWGCDNYEPIFRGLKFTNKLDIIRMELQNDPWTFVHVLSNLVALNTFVSDCFLSLRTGLLLSLASTKCQKPIHILAVCKDYDAGMNLILKATCLAKKCIRCDYPLTKTGITYNSSSKKYTGNALTLASNGICYLGHWEPYTGKTGFAIREAVQYGKIPIEKADGEHIPLRCAVWTILGKPHTSKQRNQLKTLSQVFGIAWTAHIPFQMEQYFVDFIQNRNYLQNVPISDEELKQYINSVADYKVQMVDEALEFLQNYFVCARRIRGDTLPLTSLEPLTSLAEAHARLNRRTCALIEDVLVAIHLCELSLGPCLAFPPPPTNIKTFALWLKENILQCSELRNTY